MRLALPLVFKIVFNGLRVVFQFPQEIFTISDLQFVCRSICQLVICYTGPPTIKLLQLSVIHPVCQVLLHCSTFPPVSGLSDSDLPLLILIIIAPSVNTLLLQPLSKSFINRRNIFQIQIILQNIVLFPSLSSL